jgi:hypothetical protein
LSCAFRHVFALIPIDFFEFLQPLTELAAAVPPLTSFST